MRYPALLVSAVLLASAADKGPPRGEAASKTLRLEATAYLDKTSIQQAVGSNLDEGIVVVTVTLTPSPGEKLTIDRDDFLLRSDKDGQKCTPYAPSQIAGSATLRVKTGYGGGGIASQDTGPGWGGGGIGGIGFPSSGGGIGNSGSTEEAIASVEQDSGKQKANPLLKVLKQKILPEKEIAEPITGQLYFLLEGKHKPKDIELLYKTSAGRLSIRFKQDKDK